MTLVLLMWLIVGTPIALITLLAAQFIPFRPRRLRFKDSADAANPGSKEHRGV
jgi:hypothetical protein